MTKGKTIGEEAEAKAAEYFKIYNDLKKDKNEGIAENAETLAKHDLLVEGIINRFAKEKLDVLIKGAK